MADKLFDPANPTTSETAPPPAADGAKAAQVAPGATTPGGANAPAVATTPSGTKDTVHVPTTQDASFCASANCPPNTHPAHGNTGVATGQVQVSQDILAEENKHSNIAVIDYSTWRHISGEPADQLAGFGRWCHARHAASLLSSNQWRDLFEQYKASAAK